MAKERYDIGSDVDMCSNTLYNAKIDGASCVVPKDSNSHTHDNRDALDKVSGENTGDEDKASIVQKLDITSEDVVGDSDELLADRGGNFIKVAFSKVKALLKAFFDNEYSDRTHNHNLNDLAEKSYNSLDDLPILDFEPANENIQSHIGDGDIHVTSLQKEDFHAHTNKTALDAVKGVNTGDQSSSDFDIKDLSDTTSLRSTWSGKQDALTFSTDIETDKASTTKVSAIKTFYDWAVGKFIDLTKIVTTWTSTTLNTNVPSEKLVKDSLDLKAEITTFENTVVNNWVADTTYVNFGYKADISLSGVTATDIIEIVFGHNEAVSGYYSPICLVDNGKITIYGKVNATITIPLIIKFKQ